MISATLLVAFLFICSTTLVCGQSFGSSYAGYANSFYTSAEYNQLIVVPGVGQISDSTFTGFVGNDIANQRLAVDLGAFKTYVLSNITYNVINGPGGVAVECLKVTGYTYQFEVVAKSAAIKTEFIYVVTGDEGATQTDSLVLQNGYFGFTNDPGAGLDVKIAFEAYVDFFTGQTRRTKFSQNAPRPRNPDGSCPPAVAVETGIIDMAPSFGTPNFPAGFFTPPAICQNAPEYALALCLD